MAGFVVICGELVVLCGHVRGLVEGQQKRRRQEQIPFGDDNSKTKTTTNTGILRFAQNDEH
jgi:hypothetical protein